MGVLHIFVCSAVGGQKNGGDSAILAGPVKKDFLELGVKVVFDVGVTNELVDATRH